MPKSWTDEEQEEGAKGGGLLILFLIIIACIGVLVCMLLPKTKPRVYAVSLSVGEYGGDLPEPAFVSWDPQRIGFQFSEHFDKRSTANQIKTSLESLAAEVDRQNIVVVYLRGHALVINDELYLLAGNFRKEDVATSTERLGEKARKLKDIFSELKDLRAASVLVLADICDLPSVPSLGVVANNIAELLEREIAAIKEGTPVWVIASAASLQPTHVSLLRKQTLLQAAMQYALDGRAGQTEISLAQAYESALRYADLATESSQTPVLFRSGTQGHIHDGSEQWLEAKKIRLCEPPKSNNTATVAENPESEKAVSKSSSELSVLKTETSAGNGASADQSARLDEIETSPMLRFWQLRESFRQRPTGAGWSPIDFDLPQVRQHELKATQLELLRWIRLKSEDATAEMELKELVQEWETVFKTLSSGSESGGVALKLVQAWHALQNKLSKEPEKQAWNDPKVLAPELAEQWQAVREDYRRYMDTTSELSGWLQQCIEECTQGGDLIIDVHGLLYKLTVLDDQLPSQGKMQGKAVLKNPLNPTDVDAIESALAKLRKSSDRKLDELAERFEAAVTDPTNPKKRIRWVDEQRFLKYMTRTNSSFESRKRLVKAFEAVENKPDSVSEPEADPAMRADRRSVKEILQKLDGKLAFDKYRDVSELVRHSIKWATREDLSEVPTDSVGLNKWAASVNQRAAKSDNESEVSQDVTLRWKQACLSDFLGQGKGEDHLAMLLDVSDDKSLRVVNSKLSLNLISNANEFLASANLTLARNNNGLISEYYLKWTSKENAGSTAAENLKLILSDDNVSEETPRRITPNTKLPRIDLAFEVSGNITRPAEGSALNLSLSLSDDEKGIQNLIKHPIKLAFPSPDRIELLAKCLDPGDQKFVLTEIEDGEDHVNSLHVPAIGQAKSNYQFYVKNHSEKNKTLTVSFYSVVNRSQASGTGIVTKEARQYTGDEIKRKQIPKCFTSEFFLFAPGEQKAIPLTVVPAATASADSPENPFGEFGLVCVIEEYTPKANSDDKPTKKGESYHWISCRPENPMAREVVVIASAPKVGGGPRRDFNLSITVPESVWPRWQLSEIALAASLTDRNGKAIKHEVIPFNPKLTPDEPTTSIEVTANPPFDGPAILHLDIGGYPRAVNFEAREANGFLPINSQRAFAWIGELECSTKEKLKVKTEPWEGSYVVPARIQLESTKAYQDVDVDEIKLTMRIDNPNGKDANLTFEPSSGSAAQAKIQTLKGFQPPYRKFKPSFVVNEGMLAFGATATDLEYQYLDPPQKNGKLTFGIQFEGSSMPAAISDLVFDRQAPQKPKNISVSPQVIHTVDNVLLEVEVRDLESNVAQVYFDISEKLPSPAQLSLLAEPSTGAKWVYRLSGKKLKELKEVGEYKVTCRSIDLAGNESLGPSELIDWRGDKVAPAPVVPKTAAAASAVKKEHSVQVVLSVQGAKPKYPEKITVSGISGQPLSEKSSTRTFLGVPAGDYTVTAKYDFLGKYEGKETVSVPAQGSVTIDLRQVK